MGNPLWFTRTLDIGLSVPRPGEPVVRLIEYMVGTDFDVPADRVLLLGALRWVEHAERRKVRRIQLIVRVSEMPATLASPESLKEYLLRQLRG